MDRESAERASVISALLRRLAKVGIIPENGFEAEVVNGVWVFSPSSKRESSGVHDYEETILSPVTNTQKR